MILQTANIIGGALVASGKIGEVIGRETVAKMEQSVAPYRTTIGLIVLVLGVLALIQRIGIFYLGIPYFGASFPQAIPAIFTGLLLAAPFFEKYEFMRKLIGAFKPYSAWIGLAAIACGLGSMLFGCVLPLVCRMPF